MKFEPNEQEKTWIDLFSTLMHKKPKAISLYIDNQRDEGNVEVFSAPDKPFTKAQNNWIKEIENHLNDLPSSEHFWLMSNIDGWHIGKGQPIVYHGSTYGSYGGQCSYDDNFSELTIETFSIEYCNIEQSMRDDCYYHEFCSNRGDFDLKHTYSKG